MGQDPTAALPRLTNKQRAWLAAYLGNGGNATKAAQAAGYSGDSGGWRSRGAENVANRSIRAHLDAEMAQHAMGRPEVLWRKAQIARADIDDFLAEADATTLDLEQARRLGVMPLVRELTREEWYDKDGTLHVEVKVKLYDKQAALRDLARIHGLFTDKVELSGALALEVTIGGRSND